MSADDNGANVDKILGIDLDANGSIANPADAITTKPRKTTKSLQEDHLLSVRGLKYLRKNAKIKLRPKLNHKDEFKNLDNLLSYYQIWGHNLFPRANFQDFLTMCQAAGSKRRVVYQRREWINHDIQMELVKEKSQFAFSNELASSFINDGDENSQNNSGLHHSDGERDESHNQQSQPPSRPLHNPNALFVQRNEFSDFDDDDDDLYTTITSKKTPNNTNNDDNTQTTNTSATTATLTANETTNTTETTKTGETIETIETTKTREPTKTTETTETTETRETREPTKTAKTTENDHEKDDFDEYAMMEENFDDEYAAELEAMREM